MSNNDKPEREKVSVTWKWLAVTVVSVLIVVVGYDRASFDGRLNRVEERTQTAPTKQDIENLRGALDKLSDKLDNLRDRIPPK